jgi:hypothetical protein
MVDDAARGRRAQRRDAIGIAGVRAAVVHARDVTVLALGDTRDAREQRVRQREVAAGAQIDAVARAVGHGDVAGVVALRLARVQLDRAADGVASGQRALRATQDLDTLEVEQVEHRAGQRGVVHVVHIDADAGLQRGVEIALADAADRGGDGGPEGRALRLEGDVRRLARQLCDVGLRAILEHARGDRRDRERGVLNVLFAELRGDDDLLDALTLALGFLRQCGSWKCQPCGRYGRTNHHPDEVSDRARGAPVEAWNPAVH